MYQRNNERFIIIIVSLACLGLCIESLLLGWEFWVPPLIIIGTIFLWFMRVSEKPSPELRQIIYFVFATLCTFYYGVHESSFFDIALIFSLSMLLYSFMNKPYMMNIFLAEFLILICIQIFLAKDSGVIFDALNISRIILQIVAEAMVYFICIKVINNRKLMMESFEEKVDKIEQVDKDMEDFLSNISHELRTPVNVVIGMSEMLLKKNAGSEAVSIKEAGLNLGHQIEDIQDYTECKRNKVMLEEEEYLMVSILNDAVTAFKLLNKDNRLELIIDIDPTVPAKMIGDVKKLQKIFWHLLENAYKFTKTGGIYARIHSEDTDYGVNLCIEMTDTGIGMDTKTISGISGGLYQENKDRDRSTGGIGLGLFITYGFAHRMGGFVKIESTKNQGTTVRVTIPQKVADKTNCLSLSPDFEGDILFHVHSDKYKNPMVRDFYRHMATNMAVGINVPLYSTTSIKEIENLRKRLNISVIFMGQEEYTENPDYFDDMCKKGIIVAVSANQGFSPNAVSGVIVLPKPLYAYPVIRVINEGYNVKDLSDPDTSGKRASFKGIRALVVDDEPMNLVVATGLFGEYGMIIDTAGSGMEAISKFRNGDYDVVFMDHMMPEMDGVKAMKLIRAAASELNRSVIIIALTANAVSGAREMFIAEGFDGFIAKPIIISDFEHVLQRELSRSGKGRRAVNK